MDGLDVEGMDRMTHTAYASVEEFKAQSDVTGEQWDAVIQVCLDAAAETIERVCNRGALVAEVTASARQFAGTGKDVLRIPECVAVSLVEVKNGTWSALAADDWVGFAGDPDFPHFQPPYTGLMLTGEGLAYWPETKLPAVRVTARWGYAESTPAAVKLATLAQAYRWFKRGQGSWGDSVGSAEMGLIMFKKALDPDVQMMLVNGRLVKPTI